ncbi:ATP-binding cassette domain-containing protein [Candidatus Poriferisodalis sp.]|uniref:ATP-binding cassette domain-containing protein n=1 Tax=Candidatus Poriferisodalis sp. TaxID=3101277 RepID=UPI003B01EE38
MTEAGESPASAPRADAGLPSLAIETVIGAGNRPIDLDEPAVCWYVESGALDVFVREMHDGVETSQPTHILRAEAGQLVFGVDPPTPGLSVGAKALPDSRLHRIRVAELERRLPADTLARRVDTWIAEFAGSVASRVEPRPNPDIALGIEARIDARSQSVLSARPGQVVWVTADGNATVRYLSTELTRPAQSRPVALTSDSWISVDADTPLRSHSTRDLCRHGRLAEALSEFHRVALSAEALNRQLGLADQVNYQLEVAAHRRHDAQIARRGLHSSLAAAPAVRDEGATALTSALRIIGKHERIDFRVPATVSTASSLGGDTGPVTLRAVLDASMLRARRIKLMPEDRWWRGDGGALLAWRRSDECPLALLPSATGAYRAVDPVTGRRQRLNSVRAADLAEDAWFIYRPLPADSPVKGRDLLRFAGLSAAADLVRFGVVGLLISTLTLAPALFLAFLVDWAVPARDRSALLLIVLGHVVVGLIIALLAFMRGSAMNRLQGRTGSRLTAALWDRVLDLPPKFFRDYTAGDLGVRIDSIAQLRALVTSVAATVASAAVVVPALPVLLAYNAPLAWTSLGFSVLSLGIMTLVGLQQLRPQRERNAIVRRLNGGLLQFINGISKLRVSGAEQSAFASWARNARDAHVTTLHINRLDQHLNGYSAAVPALTVAALFAVTLWQGPERVGLAAFVAVYATSASVYGALSALGSTFKTMTQVVPTYEQVKPLLDAVPNKSPSEPALSTFNGEIVLDRVSFRYAESGPLVLDDVSIHAAPGEFVAVVGASGSGKTTLLRVALGLEAPTRGGVYYDGLEMTKLDRRIGRQIGVVTQDGALLPGSILDNIIGLGGGLGIEDAWQAARLAAVDRDIAEMPMGMHTVIGDNSSIFSGGQVQRIRIAAALARRPRVLFFDEATSFLDSMSQAHVMKSVAELALTRIVIAHRLSTIRGADKIHVLWGGRLVQTGTYDELTEVSGPFLDLVQRQIV